jgi:GntR family transcriptional regulator, transcriptional repressor for pyruvate dehydrogenase complex
VIDKTGRKAFPELVAVRRRILKAMRARDAVAATKAMNEYLGTVHEVIDVEPIALHRPGRAPAAPVPPAAPLKVRGTVAKAVKLPVRSARAPLKKAAR